MSCGHVTVANRLAALAAEVAGPPVRLVRTIGDAAMLVAPEPAPLLRTSLALMDAAEAEGEGFPQLHAGVAHGRALQRYGDWYVPTVNVAGAAHRARPRLERADHRRGSQAGRRRAVLVVGGGPQADQGAQGADRGLALPAGVVSSFSAASIVRANGRAPASGRTA